MEVRLPVAYVTDRSRKSAQVREAFLLSPAGVLWLPVTKCPLLPVTIIFLTEPEVLDC